MRAVRCNWFFDVFEKGLVMREIVLDTETTGLDATNGDRIIEIGAVELWNHIETGKTYHQYINPQRSVPMEAVEVHGLDDAFLRNKPTFMEIGQAFLAFIEDSTLVIHNAEFDLTFLNVELSLVGLQTLDPDRSIDTLAMAKKKFPGSAKSLDALCRRFGIDYSSREVHGALIDAKILANVYLELIGGRQPGFLGTNTGLASLSAEMESWKPTQRPKTLPSRLTDAEKAAHDAFIAKLGDHVLWSMGQ